MPKKITLPSYMGGKRILMPGSENFGPGSYDSYRALHTGVLRDGCIIPCETKNISIARNNKGSIVDVTTSKQIYNGMVLNIFEN